MYVCMGESEKRERDLVHQVGRLVHRSIAYQPLQRLRILGLEFLHEVPGGLEGAQIQR